MKKLKADVTLNGTDAASEPINANAKYAPGQRFTGVIELMWDTLPKAMDTDFCVSYSETDRFGDQHIIQLLEAYQEPPVRRIAKVYAIFG